MTIWLETTVQPDKIDGTSTINACSEKDTVKEVRSLREASKRCDSVGLTPGCSTISRGKYVDDGLATVADRYDHLAIWLNKQVTAEPCGLVNRGLGVPPCFAAIVGCTHLNQIVTVIVVPLKVTVTVEVAGR